MVPAEEKELLLNLRDGSHVAFEHLYSHYKEHVIGRLLHIFRSPDLAQEVAQDTFVAVWEQRTSINIDKSFKSYLFAIAGNKAYNLFRRAAHDARLRTYLQPIMAEGVSQVEDYMLRKENQRILEDLLQRMPEKQREVYRLAKLEGLPYQLIAKRLGITHNTINTHIKRATAFLKEQLTNRPELLAVLLTCAIRMGETS